MAAFISLLVLSTIPLSAVTLSAIFLTPIALSPVALAPIVLSPVARTSVVINHRHKLPKGCRDINAYSGPPPSSVSHRIGLKDIAFTLFVSRAFSADR